MSRFQSRNNAFGSSQEISCFYGFIVCDTDGFRSSCINQMSVQRSYSRIIQTSGDRIWSNDLTIICLHQKRSTSVNNSFCTKYRSCCRFTRINAQTCCFYSNQSNVFFIHIMIIRTSGITSSTNASNNHIWIFRTCLFFQLPFHFFANHRLKASHHIWIWMRTNH